MTWSVLGSFAITSLILALAPGPDNIFVLTQSALYGYRKGLLVIFGLCLGILCQTLCVVVGISAFITAIPILMTLLKFAGAAYLLYLAYMAITHASAVAHINVAPPKAPTSKLIESPAANSIDNIRDDNRESDHTNSNNTESNTQNTNQANAQAKDSADHHAVVPVELTNKQLVRRGLIMNITNPKVQLFFLSFFPQFLPKDVSGLPLMGYMTLLGLIFTLATVIVFAAIAIFSGALAEKFKSVTFNRCLNYSAAVIFICLAAYTLFAA